MGEHAVIVLDTHALVWWVAQRERVPPAVRRLVDSRLKSKEQLLVSTISLWDVAMLVTADRRLRSYRAVNRAWTR